MAVGRKKLVMCQACRALIEPSRACPLCGRESVPSLRARIESGGADHFFSRLVLSLNVALFILMALAEIRAGTDPASLFMQPTGAVFYDFGGREVFSIATGQWWRLVTPNFLHLGIAHLMFNSLALYYVGPQVEEIYGSQKFIFIYLGTGIFSNIASYSFQINGAGASGAIFGLIGLLAVCGYRMSGTAGRALMRQMITWAVFGIVFGFILGADNVAHVGGGIAGAVLAMLMKPEEPSTARGALSWNGIAVGCALLIVASFTMVALNYGKFQKGPHIIQLARRVDDVRVALLAPFAAADGTARDKSEIVRQIRGSVHDLERVEQIDSTSDEIRARLANAAGSMATRLESSSDTEANLSDGNFNVEMEEASIALTEFDHWINRIKFEHGLR